MRKISGIRAISFDADGTLWDFEKVMRHSLSCVLKELQTHDSNAAALLDIDKMIGILMSDKDIDSPILIL